MKNFKFINPHLILGVTVGFIIATIINIEASWLYWALNEGTDNFEPIRINGFIEKVARLSPQSFEVIVMVISALVFIIIVLIFNSKVVKKIRLNKIGIYLLFTIVISFIVAYSIGLLLAYKVTSHYSLEQMNMKSVFTMNTLVIGLFIISIGVFIATFMLLVNKKVKYIRYLTTEVKKIKVEGFGKTIEVKGEDEISELCESINAMSLELKEKNDNERMIVNNKNELITNVSHDLRTPLTSIIGYIDIIKKKEYTNQQQLDEYVDIIDKKSKNLNKLINELFEYTKLNNHDIKLNYSEVDIVGLLEQIIGEYIYIFNKHGLVLEKDIPNKDIILNVDIEKIVRVLENLFSNAIKYSDLNSCVRLRLKEEENSVSISISNNTSEIGNEDIGSLFERFYKGDKSRKESESSGLGLAIVKRIVELHKGTVEATLKGDIIAFNIILPIE